MNVSLFQAAAAMTANEQWQDKISQNMVSSSLPGFKRQDLSFSSVAAGLMGPSGQHFQLPSAQSVTNFSPGELKLTGLKTDVAIEGDGFFEVRMPNGTTSYTRDGEFHVSATGELVSKEGFQVIGDGGPIHLDPNNPNHLSISPEGQVSQGADLKGRIKVVDFKDPRLLKAIGGSHFVAENPDAQPREMQKPSVRQGFLEAGNTSPVTEMATLIGVMRTFEANQRIMQMHDERMGKVITELAGTN